MSETTNPIDLIEAAAMRITSNSKPVLLSKITHLPIVQLDENNIQKYVLISVPTETGSKFFVRGSKTAAYHRDAARDLVQELKSLEVPFEVMGGGRIDHKPGTHIKIFGYSYGFPWKDGKSLHYVTADLMATAFPKEKVEFSDEGY